MMMTKYFERKGEQGFTLLELAVVVLVLSILVALVFSAAQSGREGITQELVKGEVLAVSITVTEQISYGEAVQPGVVYAPADSGFVDILVTPVGEFGYQLCGGMVDMPGWVYVWNSDSQTGVEATRCP